MNNKNSPYTKGKSKLIKTEFEKVRIVIEKEGNQYLEYIDCGEFTFAKNDGSSFHIVGANGT